MNEANKGHNLYTEYSSAKHMKDLSEMLDQFDNALGTARSDGNIGSLKEAQEETQATLNNLAESLDAGGEVREEKMREIFEWLNSKGSWSTGKSLSEYAVGAPEGISVNELQEILNRIDANRTTMGFDEDIRGHYITVLAHKIIQEKILKWVARNPGLSDKEIVEHAKDVTIRLEHPDLGPESRDKLADIGGAWEEGVLILRGNYGRDIGAYMTGGKVIVEGNVESGAGMIMDGGDLIINGAAQCELGYGMRGGSIMVKIAAPCVGCHMHGGKIEVSEKVDTTMPGPDQEVIDDPMIGVEKTGGVIIVAGKEF